MLFTFTDNQSNYPPTSTLKTLLLFFCKEMFDVGDDINGGVDQAVDVAVAEHAKKKAATKKHQKSCSIKKDSRGKKASAETKEKEALLPAAAIAEEKEENRVLARALGDIDGGVAAEERETGTEATLPTLASSEPIGEVAETVTEATVPAPASAAATEEVSETVTEAEDMPGPALATEPRKKRGKGPKKAAKEESENKDITAMKVAPKKRGRKAAAVAAPNKEEEETEKKPGAKRGRKAVASVEEKREEEEAPELAVPEPEVSSSTR